ncbi:hypothetical protein AVEN_93965-1 [Araneus ventricosus]|uniref:Uncharacterized protein n=1 Tax=Araneus ventricosus TaxID=182803 RepID=A0A4Y2CKU8_ARAVE|nr:hypothetical protein AVEN_93965-1 [Araneus ventricosus]
MSISGKMTNWEEGKISTQILIKLYLEELISQPIPSVPKAYGISDFLPLPNMQGSRKKFPTMHIAGTPVKTALLIKKRRKMKKRINENSNI